MYSEGVLKNGLSKVPELNKCFASVFTKDIKSQSKNKLGNRNERTETEVIITR